MNKEERDHFITWVKEDVAEVVKNVLDNEMMPALDATPFVTIADEEDGIYVNAVEEDDEGKYARIVPWGDFVEIVLASDQDLIDRYLPLFRDLVKRMEADE